MSKPTKHELGFYIKSSELKNKIPLDCPVCGFTIRDQADILAYNDYECCNDCKIVWAEPNLKKWKEGWRPPEEKISKYRENLLSRPSYLVI